MTSTTLLKTITEATYRANPSYKLMLFDRLSVPQQEKVRSLIEEQSYYGVLLDKEGNGNTTKVVDEGTALLYLTMKEPGPLPAYFLRKYGQSSHEVVAELVLEGVLQIAGKDQTFLSGGSAHGLLFGTAASGTKRLNRLVALSHEALCYAQVLPITSVTQLGWRLYRYNTVPCSPTWRRSWKRDQTVARWLGLQNEGSSTARLNRFWQAAPVPDEDGWLNFFRNTFVGNGNNHIHFPFKLYISPMPDHLPQVWPAILDWMTRSDVPAFKIGSSLPMILRPDKMVAYLPDFTSLSAVAADLQAVLEGCPAQGVPFTAPIDSQGLLSWGMDPQFNRDSTGQPISESWRSWITEQLAAAIIEAKSSNPGAAPVSYALDRISLQGVDTETWTLKQSMWRKAGSTYANSQ